tara:strand:- start:852 stop:3278 length:2427 start_codon:yes stop_codon:yes gene_type:complete
MINVVMFWKQNDSELYGRRSDMVAKYLASRSDVGKVLVLDAPIDSDALEQRNSGERFDQNPFVYEGTKAIADNARDHGKLYRRVFVYDKSKQGIADYFTFLEQCFKALDIDPAKSVFWMYPKLLWGEQLINHFKPAKKVMDVVDDHRAWPNVNDTKRKQLNQHYEAMLSNADKVLTNCLPVKLSMYEFNQNIALVPNGCDINPPITLPESNQHYQRIASHKGPVLGFVGNLEAKIDDVLLRRLSTEMPDALIVLIGSTHANPSIRALEALPNVVMTGVVPYPYIGAFVRLFTVGMVPHKRMDLTENMNPLKVYVYLTHHVPVVATDVPNIAVCDYVWQSSSHDAFINNVKQVIIQRSLLNNEVFDSFTHCNSWQMRLAVVTDSLLDDRNSQSANEDAKPNLLRLDGQESNASIFVIDKSALSDSLKPSRKKVAAIVFTDEAEQALDSARLFAQRANHELDVYVVPVHPNEEKDVLRQILRFTSYRYIMLADQNAFPCRDWLQFAYNAHLNNDGAIVRAASGGSLNEKHNYLFSSCSVLRAMLSGESVKEVTDARFLVADLRLSTDKGSPSDSTPISVIDVNSLASPAPQFERDICVVMPCINEQEGIEAAKLLKRTSGIDADFVVALDTQYQGFIKTLNQTARLSAAKYIVYLAEDAVPGHHWLRTAYEKLEQANKSVLAFNCGKWHGRIAAFGMVRKDWVYQYYGDCILYEGYRSHRADNELTVIARACDQFIYAPDAILLENDKRKDFKKNESEASNFTEEDKNLFKKRFKNGFGGLLDYSLYEALHDEYLRRKKFAKSQAVLVIE